MCCYSPFGQRCGRCCRGSSRTAECSSQMQYCMLRSCLGRRPLMQCTVVSSQLSLQGALQASLHVVSSLLVLYVPGECMGNLPAYTPPDLDISGLGCHVQVLASGFVALVCFRFDWCRHVEAALVKVKNPIGRCAMVRACAWVVCMHVRCSACREECCH